MDVDTCVWECERKVRLIGAIWLLNKNTHTQRVFPLIQPNSVFTLSLARFCSAPLINLCWNRMCSCSQFVNTLSMTSNAGWKQRARQLRHPFVSFGTRARSVPQPTGTSSAHCPPQSVLLNIYSKLFSVCFTHKINTHIYICSLIFIY